MKDETNGKSQSFTTNSMYNGDWKIILPNTYPNGGNFTFTVKGDQTPQTIYNITFGDVYICSGQSNMVVPMEYTFSRNYTYSNITKLGKYNNIRFLQIGNQESKFCIYDNDTSYVTPTNYASNGRYLWQQNYRIDILDTFSAPCWYFAQVLSDKYGLDNITFGLIGNIVGGSIIESWIKNHTIDSHCNPKDHIPTKPGFGCLYNGMVLPYINYTIKGGLWYQGENDVGQYPAGNILNNTGYACLERLLIKQWRSNWSVIENTTDPLFHFGLVTLAAGTSEGHEGAMGDFRWAQTFNYDIMPNMYGINTFVAQGYDIGDPWSGSCKNYGICNTTNAPYSIITTKNLDNSPLHPRPKIYVGQRLARKANKFIYGNDGIWSGPLISGCSMENNKIIINFNKTMLYEESVIIKPWNMWYNTSIPPALQWTAFEVLINKTKWIYTNDNALSQGNDGSSVILDISQFNDGSNTIDGLRYAWNDYPCCGTLNRNIYPCPMNSCPIVTSKSLLPAPPILAQIVNNKCVCYEPQQC